MKTFAWIPIGLALAFATPAHAYAADPPRPIAQCLPLAQANEQDALIAKQDHLTVIELSIPEIASFNAILDNPFNELVDIVTVFIHPDDHAEYVIGNRAQAVKCSAEAFVMTPDEVDQLLRVIHKVGA